MGTRLLVIWCGLAALLLARPAQAQRPPKATATLSTGILKYGALARLDVEVDGAGGAQLLPMDDVDGLRFSRPGTPSVSTFTTFIGGQRMRKVTTKWSLGIEALREGEFELPEVRFDVDGKQFSVPVQPTTLKVVRDLEGEDLGFLEIVGVPSRVYEGQPFSLDIRAGWDAKLQVATAGLLMPWWNRLAGVLELEDDRPATGRKPVELSLNRSGRMEMEMDQLERDGRPFVLLEKRLRLMATRPGTLLFREGVFEYGEIVASTGFGGQRRTRDFYAVLPEFSLEVLRVPEEGQPFGWTGAVGTLVADREVDVRDVDQGASLELTVRWTGSGNLEFFDLPDLERLDAFRGFRVLGVEDRPSSTLREVVWELVPMDANLSEIPAVPLSVFDPEREAYTEVATQPVPIRVRAVAGGDDPSLGGPVLDGPDLTGIDPEPRADLATWAPGAELLLGGYLALPLLWWFGRSRVRRGGDPAGPRARRRRRAPKRLGKALARSTSASDQRSAFCEYLGARTDQASESWVGRAAHEFTTSDGTPLVGEAAAVLDQALRSLDEAVHARGDAKLEARVLLDAAARTREAGL